MDLLLPLLSALAVLAVVMLIKIRSELRSLNQSLIAVLNAHADQRKYFGDELLSQFENISSNIAEVHNELVEIRQTTDIIYKYKLPSKSERDFLDQISIDNEVLDGNRHAQTRHSEN